ncbi:bifunctional DNA primase/polymerase [Microbacterium lacticum]|uniref:Bifunctional DNA primase/polymerase-like protein n=3 Tax=Microbacterium lacticum TaxID=33885 RepID=A0A543L0I6_9MICO|nr:bifunctional DNA primase/polymerase [Microbacterium lacticum]TQN00845.1 bifunctional DNA primase/polymerase-like protein [Microbacterium lacticum]
MSVASVLGSVSALPLSQAAVRLAAAGVPVFPCVPGAKNPLLKPDEDNPQAQPGGFHAATTDARRVAAWWRRWPAANIGVPTGAASGVEVVDVDRKPGGDGFAAFERARRAGLVPGWLAVVRSASGGAHFYFPADPDRPQRSWQAATAHVDFRGDGGYIIVPPSAVGGAGSYELVAGADRAPGPVDAARLRDFLDPRPEPTPHRVSGPIRSRDAARLAAWVAMRAEGERNRGLFWASCRLAEAGLSLPEMVDALAPAGKGQVPWCGCSYCCQAASGGLICSRVAVARASSSGSARVPISSRRSRW